MRGLACLICGALLPGVPTGPSPALGDDTGGRAARGTGQPASDPRATVPASVPTPGPRLPLRDRARSAARSLPVQFDGRVMPLDTMARRLVEHVTGGQRLDGADAVTVLLSWVFEPDRWSEQPIIALDRDLAAHIGLTPPRPRASYSVLMANDALQQLAVAAWQARQGGQTLSPLDEEALALVDRLETFEGIRRRRLLPLVPHPDDPAGPWMAPGRLDGYSEDQRQAVNLAWQALGEAYHQRNATQFARSLSAFRDAVAALPGSGYPSGDLLTREVWYNRLQPVRLSWVLLLAAAGVGVATRWIRRAWLVGLAIGTEAIGLTVLTVGLALRWQIAGRIPAANFYESLVLLGWGVAAFSLIALVVLRDRLIPINAALLAGGFLMLADLVPGIEGWIRPIPPVLRNTIWMSIHVPTIMLGYAVLAEAVVLAHVQIGSLGFGRARPATTRRLDWLVYWCLLVGSLLLLVGILTGSMWANTSWSRWWGWDPKEVWSLAAFGGYMALLHARRQGWLGPFGTAGGSIAAIGLVAATYLFVNFGLGTGLHTYAAGSADHRLAWLIVVFVAAVEAAFVGAAYLRRKQVGSG